MSVRISHRIEQLFTEVWIWDYTENIKRVDGWTPGFGALIFYLDGTAELIHFNKHWKDHKRFIPDSTTRKDVMTGKTTWEFHGELVDHKATMKFKQDMLKAFKGK